ncbi:MAG: hypothetical protein Q7R76_03025 [Candidatus Woesearchaeota archaeon]|nr:hypothetical protein [Candidatus Woesearchaeota archaeon]
MEQPKKSAPKDFLGFMLDKANKPDSVLDPRPLGNVDAKQVEQLTNQLKKQFGKK